MYPSFRQWVKPVHWMQYTVYTPPYTSIPLHPLHPLCNCIHWFDLFAPKTMSSPPYIAIPLCPLHTVSKDNVPTTIYHYSTAYCIHCVLWFDLLAPKTMSSPPYTTIPLCTASTASTGLTFLHQRQCPHHHIPIFHCVLHTASTVYCVHCIYWFDLFAPKTMSPLSYFTIPLCTAYCVHCILHPLHPLV